ncbi:vomeronasal type-2 receptor 26-like [Anomaloglossus baeobatrachus]
MLGQEEKKWDHIEHDNKVLDLTWCEPRNTQLNSSADEVEEKVEENMEVTLAIPAQKCSNAPKRSTASSATSMAVAYSHLPTSSSFINALRCFIAIRGLVKHIRSDRGTNFVGAARELQIPSNLDIVNIESFYPYSVFTLYLGYSVSTVYSVYPAIKFMLPANKSRLLNSYSLFNGNVNEDSDVCSKCPEDEWPDEKKVKCIPKTFEFLSYEKDILVYVFSALSLFFSIITLFILGIFINYWDTPIIKANNRTVSFILLTSIFFSFLCVFFFLGCPKGITCLLRQISFGIFFSIAVSSLLAKTITVCIAFKATKPGSSWVKMASPKVSNYLVLVCSSVQAFICVIWLLVSPPYLEFNHHSYRGTIVIQCNEGSDIWFYSMLGYMGFLAAVCFVLAFMVRTLPDSFNEAKYITFSMLVFCSVWIAMIPAYLSTKGKYMVIIEIFAILTSCAGILGCIFLPKLYILLLKPELNSRNIILDKNKICVNA